jgi:hypothetical protein
MSADTFAATYPKLPEFETALAKYDPQGLFRHALWDGYFAE